MIVKNSTHRTNNIRSRTSSKIARRRGAAVVEFALVLPVLFLIVFGAIQACNVIFLKQYVTEVSYQGALYASREEATEANVESDMQEMLAARGITSAVVELSGLSGQSFDTLGSDQNYRVRIQVSPNSLHVGPNVTSYTQLTVESFGRKP